MEGDPLLVIFDGQCPFCIGWIKFLLDRDGDDRLRFAALQSQWTRNFLSRHGLPEPDLESILVWDGRRLLRESEALTRIAGELPGIWHLGRHAEMLPEGLRDKAYRFVAERRHRWFGHKQECWVPKEGDRRKFLDLSDTRQQSAGHESDAGDADPPHPREGDF